MLVNINDNSNDNQRKTRVDSIRNRQRILAAMAFLFDTYGLTVTLEAVAKKANVGIGTVYRNFPTKQAAIEAVIEMTMDGLVETSESLIDAKNPGEALLDFMLYMGRSAKLKHSLVKALDLTEGSVTDSLRQKIQAFDANFMQLVTNAQKAGIVRADITPTDIRVLLAGCVTPTERYKTVDTDTLVRIVYRGICT